MNDTTHYERQQFCLNARNTKEKRSNIELKIERERKEMKKGKREREIQAKE